jgi:hypothetical protein
MLLLAVEVMLVVVITALIALMPSLLFTHAAALAAAAAFRVCPCQAQGEGRCLSGAAAGEV